MLLSMTQGDSLSPSTTDITPIKRLPTDVLSLIFRSRCEDEPLADAARCALTISHVCSYWRAIALHDSAIWSRFDTAKGHTSLVELLFERSRGHLKELHHSLATHTDTPPALDRVKELNLTASCSHQFYDFWAKLAAQVPDLRVLSLDIEMGAARNTVDVDLVLIKAPNMRRLKLYRCQWTSVGELPTSTNLTTIQFHSIPLSYECVIGICRLFRASTRLTAIDICGSHKNAGQYPITATLREREKISLKHLRTLILVNPSSYVVIILGAIVIPDTVQTVMLNTFSASSSAVPSTVRDVDELVSPRLLPPSLLRNSHRMVIIIGSTTRNHRNHRRARVSWRGNRENVKFHIEVSWLGDVFETLSSMLLKIHDTHPVCGVTIVDIRSQFPRNATHTSLYGELAVPLQFMARLSSLAALRLDNWHNPRPFLDKLLEMHAAHGQTLWPNLQFALFGVPRLDIRTAFDYTSVILAFCRTFPRLRRFVAWVSEDPFVEEFRKIFHIVCSELGDPLIRTEVYRQGY